MVGFNPDYAGKVILTQKRKFARSAMAQCFNPDYAGKVILTCEKICEQYKKVFEFQSRLCG